MEEREPVLPHTPLDQLASCARQTVGNTVRDTLQWMEARNAYTHVSEESGYILVDVQSQFCDCKHK